MNTPLIPLGDFKEISSPELHQNNDIPLSANYLGFATIAVEVDHPFKTQLLVASAANAHRAGDWSKKGNQGVHAYAFFPLGSM